MEKSRSSGSDNKGSKAPQKRKENQRNTEQDDSHSKQDTRKTSKEAKCRLLGGRTNTSGELRRAEWVLGKLSEDLRSMIYLYIRPRIYLPKWKIEYYYDDEKDYKNKWMMDICGICEIPFYYARRSHGKFTKGGNCFKFIDIDGPMDYEYSYTFMGYVCTFCYRGVGLEHYPELHHIASPEYRAMMSSEPPPPIEGW